jgi:hypothetical protein
MLLKYKIKYQKMLTPFLLFGVLSWSMRPAAHADSLQALASHWGGLSLPGHAGELKLGFYTFALTRFGQVPSYGPTARGRQQLSPLYGEIRRDFGGNLFTGAYTWGFDYWNLDVEAGLGWKGSQPVELFQNNVIHRPSGIDPIPWLNDTWTESYQVSASTTLRFTERKPIDSCWASLFSDHDDDDADDPPPRCHPLDSLYASFGFSAGSIYREVFLRFGLQDIRFCFWDRVCLNTHGSLRIGSAGGGIYESLLSNEPDYSRRGLIDPELASRYVTFQSSFSLELPQYAISAGLAFTNTSGLFLKHDDNGQIEGEAPFEEEFYAIRVQIGRFHFEQSNDSRGGKDRGPSFSATLGYRINLLDDQPSPLGVHDWYIGPALVAGLITTMLVIGGGREDAQ